MKKFYAVIFALVLFGLYTNANAQAVKVGVVNMETIAQQMPEAKQAQKDLQDMTKKYQDTLMQMQSSLEEKFQQYQKQKGMMTPEQQQKEEAALQQENMQILQYRESIFGQTGLLIQKNNALLEPIREKIRLAIEKVSKKEKITLVFDTSSTSLLYFDEKFDITFRVLDEIKRGNK